MSPGFALLTSVLSVNTKKAQPVIYNSSWSLASTRRVRLLKLIAMETLQLTQPVLAQLNLSSRVSFYLHTHSNVDLC
jgi:hypothetical protein